MAGRFTPPNPFNNNAENAVNTLVLFIAWLREIYRAVKLGLAQASMKALMSDKFLSIDTPETYEKRIRPCVDALPFADALPILYSHLPENLELRIKIRNPVDLNDFFTQLNDKYLEAGGRVGVSSFNKETLSHSSIQKDSQAEHEFIVCLTKDLDYLGVAIDISILGPHIYDELGKRLGRKVSNVRRSPFSELEVRNTNTTKKAVRKVKQKAPVKRFIRLCSVCRKAGHIKTNCFEVKTTKKVNYVYQNAEKDPITREPPDDSEEPEIEYVLEEEVRDSSEPEIGYILEEEVEEDVEYVDDDESTLNTSDRNCYAIKKKWYEVQYL
jgi:hypothetical protein